MKRRLRIPLRVKFLGALLLLVTAVVSVITFTMANMFHQDKSAYVSDLVSVVAMSTADECRSVVEGYREKLLSYSRILRDPGIANERKKILVGGYFGDSPELLALYLHADGRIQASAHDEAGLRAAGLRKADLDEELGRQGLPMDRVLAGEILVRNGSIPGKLRCLTMALAAPTEEGLGPAAVVGVLRLDSLQRLAERSEVFDVAVSDGSGTLLAHRDASLVESRAALAIDPSALDLVRTANAAVTTRYEGEGSDMVGGVTAVGIGGLTVSAGLPAAVAYLASRSLLTRLVGVSLLVLVIVALAAEFWARRITRPVDLLSAAAREVGKGRFETKVDVDSGDEIGTLADSFNRMSDELHKRDAALGEAQAQLVQSEKMAAFGLLGAGIAHEVKNPLAGILGCAQISLRKAEPGSPIRTNLELIEKETKRCKTIIDNLLKFARQDRTEFAPTRPNEPVENAIAIVRHQLEIRNVKIETDLAQDLPTIRGNGNQLQQVLMNLMINAQQAIGEGGGEVVVTTRRADPPAVEIRVRDDGPGMKPEVRSRVFEPFFTTKPGGKGTGLGLSVSFGIVKDHGGEISVESEPGKGSTFVIRLPALDDSAAESSDGTARA